MPGTLAKDHACLHPWYYHGIPSRPICLATSRIVEDPGAQRYPRSVTLLPPSPDHPIGRFWSTNIVPAIDRLARERNAPIDSGHVADETAQHIVWLGVKGAEWDAEQAQSFVSLCRSILIRYQLFDVEVEVCSGGVQPLSKPEFFTEPIYESNPEFEIPFKVSLGMNIAPAGCSAFGSGGLFLTLDDDSQLYMLTAAHCVSSDQASERDLDGSSPGPQMLTFSQASFERHLEAIQTEASAQRRLALRLMTSYGRNGQEDNLVQAQAATKRDTALMRLHSRLEAEWSDPMDWYIGNACCWRGIGSVAAQVNVAGVAGSTEERDLTEDWALINLDMTRFGAVEHPNQLFLADDTMGPDRDAGTAPVDDVLSITSVSADVRVNEGTTIVYKRGAASGQTVGVASPIRSFIRRRTDDATFLVWDIPIFGRPEEKDFSKGGDSGSIVVDASGQALGLIHRGFKDVSSDGKLGVDITLATPISFIFDRIRNVTGRTPHLAQG